MYITASYFKTSIVRKHTLFHMFSLKSLFSLKFKFHNPTCVPQRFEASETHKQYVSLVKSPFSHTGAETYSLPLTTTSDIRLKVVSSIKNCELLKWMQIEVLLCQRTCACPFARPPAVSSVW